VLSFKFWKLNNDVFISFCPTSRVKHNPMMCNGSL
jgi:hypothetical protein